MTAADILNAKAAVFDLDGTLLDSMRCWSDIDERFLAKRGINKVPDDYMLAIAHLGAAETAIYTKERFGLSDTPEELMREWHDDAVNFYTNEVELKPGAHAYLDKLKAAGVKLAVATASSEELYIPALKRCGIYGHFGTVASVNECVRKKGFPDVYELACERLGVSAAETVVFEDILVAIRGAKAGGFRTVGVYDEASERDAELIRAECDLYIRSFAELCDQSHQNNRK